MKDSYYEKEKKHVYEKKKHVLLHPGVDLVIISCVKDLGVCPICFISASGPSLMTHLLVKACLLCLSVTEEEAVHS